MQLELSAAIQPELRAVDAYNARELLVEWLRTHGVTTIHTGHAPGALVSGQTMIVKTVGNEVEDATLVPVADGGMHARRRRVCEDRASRRARAPRQWRCCAPSW